MPRIPLSDETRADILNTAKLYPRLTQQALAHRFGVSQGTISAVLNGSTEKLREGLAEAKREDIERLNRLSAAELLEEARKLSRQVDALAMACYQLTAALQADTNKALLLVVGNPKAAQAVGIPLNVQKNSLVIPAVEEIGVGKDVEGSPDDITWTGPADVPQHDVPRPDATRPPINTEGGKKPLFLPRKKDVAVEVKEEEDKKEEDDATAK